MSALATIYIGEPDVPPDMTIAEYRHLRAPHVAWWRRVRLHRAPPTRSG